MLVLISIIIFTIHEIYSIPKLIFSLRNDKHDHLREVLYKNCSLINEYSSLFICSNDIFYHIEFNIDISLAPFQSQFNTCGIIIKYYYLSRFSQRTDPSLFYTSHNNQDSIVFKQRSILSVDNINWNKSLTVIIYNNIYPYNYCSFQLLPIGLHCSFIYTIQPYNVSCYLDIQLSKYDPFENDNKYLYMIKKTDEIQQRNNSNHNLFVFLTTIFLLTISPLILFIGNIIYIDRIQNNTPHYLTHYDRR